MKFKLKVGKGSVSEFTVMNATFKPGDVVDLPQIYEGVAWLERVDPVPEVKAPPQKITPMQSQS